MLRASVPEAPIDQDGDLRTREDDVDRHVLDPTMESEPEPFGVKSGPEGPLRYGVLALHPAHDLGAGERGPSRLAGVLLQLMFPSDPIISIAVSSRHDGSTRDP
jgi:hypothetical protein